MRLPIAKVHRAFPELDRFSDRECEGFIRRVQRNHPLAVAGLTLAIITALVVLIPGVLMMMFGLISQAEAWWPPLRGWQGWFAAQISLVVIGLSVTVSIMLFVPRDWWLRRAITRGLFNARCLGCHYSLLGLNVRDGAVICPECGLECVLAGRVLTPEDILAGRLPDKAPPRAPQAVNDLAA